MTYSYYPGCTLKNKAKELDYFARESAKVLGFELCELSEWQCCGGTYQTAKNEIAPKLSSVRALADSRKSNQDLVTLCSACYNVLKQVNAEISGDENVAFKVNNYLKADGYEYHGETKVIHYLEVLRDTIGFEKVKEAVAKANGGDIKNSPFFNKKIGAYYGCLLLRPSKVMQFDDPENPEILEDFIKALGAVPVIYAERNECCGAYTMFEDEKIPQNRTKKIITNAKDFGAEFLITSCPLCRYNLIKNQSEEKLDVIYFSEILANALGIKGGLDA
ncbi:MAG: CoB--CoM heterodisulfide reductase iron-sulfur subunit B family protein [Treponema sp.]|nr:CoB--CoM heterodisulfide reductase iron-sulfur subunit B family protein [Candidatus Treponema merdequi]